MTTDRARFDVPDRTGSTVLVAASASDLVAKPARAGSSTHTLAASMAFRASGESGDGGGAGGVGTTLGGARLKSGWAHADCAPIKAGITKIKPKAKGGTWPRDILARMARKMHGKMSSHKEGELRPKSQCFDCFLVCHPV